MNKIHNKSFQIYQMSNKIRMKVKRDKFDNQAYKMFN